MIFPLFDPVMDHNRDFTISLHRIFWIILGILTALLAFVVEAKAQSPEVFIYGKVHTGDQVYQGVLRWGNEEILWIDHFNAVKSKNDYYQRFDTEKKDNSDWFSFDWRLSSIWENKSTIFQFTCQFGDLKQLTVSRGEDVNLTFKNGVEIKVNGSGYNDIGSAIHVYDEELGTIDIRWERIKKIEFFQAPTSLKFRERPLYGKVETSRKGTFTGFIAWDKDERIGSDKLNGKSRDGSMDIPFSDISTIEKRYDGSQVALKSGQEYFLTGSNDVNSSNRGIVVYLDGVGAVEIPWREFKSITFIPAPQTLPSYKSFEAPKMLSGKVITYDDREVPGNLIYDVDETWNLEMLEGMDDELKYIIPMRNIKSIRPKNFNYSMVAVRNGDPLLIGGVRDVSADNAGVLVFTKNSKEPEHIAWRKISEIIFD